MGEELGIGLWGEGGLVIFLDEDVNESHGSGCVCIDVNSSRTIVLFNG